MYRLEFRKLVSKFMDDVRRLAREELMEGLQKLYVFRPKHEKTARALGPKRTPTHVLGGGKPCRVPGCGKVSKGPRFDFFCEVHRTMSKRDKEAVKRGEKVVWPRPTKKAVRAKPRKAKAVAAKPVASKPAPTAEAPKNGKTARLVVIDGKRGIEYNGTTLTYEGWAKKLGMNKDAVRHRLRRGATPLEAITP